MQPKWITSSYSRDSSNLRLRPGTFSNPLMNPRLLQDPQLNKHSTSYYINTKQSRDKSPGNMSHEHISRTHMHISSENEVFTSILDTNANLSQNTSNIVRPLAEKNGNIMEREPRIHSNLQSERQSSQEKLHKKENMRLNTMKQTPNNLPAPGNGNRNSTTATKSPASYSSKKYGMKGPATSSKKNLQRIVNVNDENSEVPNQTKFGRSQSSLTLRNSVEHNKSQVQNSQMMSYGFAEETAMQEDERLKAQKLRKENQDLLVTVTKLHAELQHEKKKCTILETEVENFKDDLLKEREKYKEELCKISQQIKKLRNIQNIYVNEKKHSEKLENQLNAKEQIVTDLSHLLWYLYSQLTGLKLLVRI